MRTKLNRLIPVLTTEAGACLTMANWQEIGVQTVTYYLDAYLMKPGYSLLKSLPSLQCYCGWEGGLVLNATLPAANSLGIYSLRSRYDGCLLTINQEQLFSLLSSLGPDWLILPRGLATYLARQDLFFPKTINCFAPPNEESEVCHLAEVGVYLSYEKTKPFADFLSEFQRYRDRPTYVAGDFSLLQAEELIASGASWLESNEPAKDALLGQLYSEEGTIQLLDSEMANQHKPILAGCPCPTCSQGLTRAYLHHLLKQTPLLCQRFLVQHNSLFTSLFMSSKP